MGAWGAGIFENDDAADWANEFDETDPAERLAFIEDTFALTDDVDHGQLDIDDCSAVLAAAAVVAAQLPNGPRLDTTYGPQTLGDGPGLTVTPHLREKAVAAVQAVIHPDTEWSQLWDESANTDARSAATHLLGILSP